MSLLTYMWNKITGTAQEPQFVCGGCNLPLRDETVYVSFQLNQAYHYPDRTCHVRALDRECRRTGELKMDFMVLMEREKAYEVLHPKTPPQLKPSPLEQRVSSLKA